MVVQIDHYAVLGLASGAGLSKEEIKKAYWSKLLVVHDPAEFLKLLDSYQVLEDPKSRKLFDDHLRIQREREEKVRRRRKMSRSAASSFVKEEDIIDVEGISKVTKEAKRRRMMSTSAASSFVKEEDIIDVESISKTTQLPSDDLKRRSANAFVDVSKIAAKQEDNDSKTGVKGEDISRKQMEDEGKEIDEWLKCGNDFIFAVMRRCGMSVQENMFDLKSIKQMILTRGSEPILPMPMESQKVFEEYFGTFLREGSKVDIYTVFRNLYLETKALLKHQC